MVFAVSEGKLLAVQRPTYQAPTSLRISDDYSEDYATLYRKQQSVRTVVDFLARNVAQLSLHTFQRIDDNDRARVHDHPFAKLMREPNPYTTGYRLMRDLIADRGIYDRALWIKTRMGATDALVRVPPRLWEIDEDDNWLAPSRFTVKGNRGKTKIPAEHCIYFRGYNPEDERHGLSPIESLRRILSEEYAAGQMREQSLRNGARIGGYIERPAGSTEWSDAARRRFAAGWRAQYSGQTATEGGGTPVLEDGMKFVAAGHSASDMQYIEARKLSREEAASAYFIPPPMVGILDHATFGNIEEQHKMLYQDTLGPILQEIQQEIALQLIRAEFPNDADELYAEFNMLEKLRGSFEEQAQQLQSSVGAPFLTRNEARAKLNLPRLEGADELVVPLNVLIGGLASPTDQVEAGSGGSTWTNLAAVDGEAAAKELAQRVTAATALIRAGFDPTASLLAVGLDPIQHLGLLPVTIQKPVEPEGIVDASIVEEVTKALEPQRKAAASVKAEPAASDAEQLRRMLVDFFRRQRAVVLSALGAKSPSWWGEERWNEELAQDLFRLFPGLSTTAARAMLERAGRDPDSYDEGRTLEFLKAVAQSRAGMINAATLGQIEDILAGDGPADVQSPAHVFDVAESSRADQISITLAGAIAAFSTYEAGKQSGATTKTWVVTSTDPRASHAAMNGETVEIEAPFSNGAMWPGDPVLGADGVAGCQCEVEVTYG